jgi:hypothetical protein
MPRFISYEMKVAIKKCYIQYRKDVPNFSHDDVCCIRLENIICSVSYNEVKKSHVQERFNNLR